MAVSKKQLAEWSKAFEEKYPEESKKSTYTVPEQKKEKVSREQLAQWSAEFDTRKQAPAAQPTAKDTMYADALEEYRAKNNLGFASEMDARNDDAMPQLNYYGKLAQKFKAGTEALEQKRDRLDDLNQWYDDPRNQQLVADITARKNAFTTYAERSTSRNADSAPAALNLMGNSNYGLPTTQSTEAKYTDDQLVKRGYSAEEIAQARQYLKEISEIPEAKQQGRRLANLAGGIADTVEAAPFLAGEYAVQAGKNLAQSAANRKALEAEVAKSPREKNLYERLMETDMEYQPKYSTGDLLQQGFTREEIDSMKARIAGTEAQDSVDPEKSLGYQIYNRGQKLNASAQSGLSPAAKAVQGVVSSAAENLVVGAVNPALVLPVLSAQGAAEAMGQSVEKNESAGKALAGGLAKFGAGWAINSVGAADLARTMGSDYAKDTVAGQIADWVRGLAGDGALAQSYPAVANAISGGMDNAMQAFVETYADQAIDAALGDEEAAKTMFSKETFLNALESGLSGGASGALGGAVGTGLGAVRGKLATASNEISGSQVEMPEDKNAKYSIQVDGNGKEYVKIDEDILKDVPKENWKNTVRDAIRDLFPDGFERDGQKIDNTREGRGEFVRSKYTRGLERSNAQAYEDKMRMTPNLDEVISTSDDVQNEAARHDNGKAFNRAKINIRVGANDYSADVLTAIKNDGREVFYDIVNLEPTKIKAPAETAERESSGNRPTEADENFRRTADESVEFTSRGQPEISETSIPAQQQEVKRSDVEKAGETVEKSYADEALQVDERQLNTGSWDSEQKQAARQLARNAWMSTQAAQTVVDNMPGDVGAGVYVQAANSLYRLGVSGVESFEKALDLSGPMSWGGATRQVMSLGQRGENALRLAYLQGKGEAEAYHEKAVRELGQKPGPEALRTDAGTYYKNGDTPSKGGNGMDAFIELGAKATGTTVRRVLDGVKNNAKGCIKTATSEIFLSGQADVETVMHETLHELNSWSAETGQAYIDTLMNYLVQANGMENTDALVRSYLTRYEEAGQKLTYNQAAEEIAADSMRAVFGDAEGFRNFVRQQAYEAEANARARGTIDRVMGKIKSLLETVLRDMETLLGKEPTNAAAKAARNLTKEQLRDLQALYFDHQRQAGENYRAALEANKNAPAEAKTATDEAGKIKFQLHEGKDSLVEQMNENLEQLEMMETVATIRGTEVSFGATRKENIANVAEYFDSIGNHVEREHFGTVELTAKSARTTIQHGNSAAKQAAVAAVPEIIRNGEQIGYEKNWQDRGYDTYVFAAPVEINGVRLYESAIVNEYVRDNGRKMFYVHEVCWTDGSYVTLNDQGVPTKKENIPTPLPKAVRSRMEATRETFSNNNIAQDDVNFKADDTKYQLDVEPEDVETTKAAALGNVEQQTETIRQAVEAGGNKRVSDEGLMAIARALRSDQDTRMDAKTIAARLGALSDYLSQTTKPDWNEATAFVSDLAEQMMHKSARKNDELWKAYPELHKLSMKVEKGSTDYQEIVYRWGSWANARKELARHGVNITQTKEGEPSRWDADFTELQKKIGAGLLPDEVPNSAADALDAMAAAHDAVKPVMENAFDEDWEGAKQDIAMQIWQRYMESPELAIPANQGLREEFAEHRQQVRDAAQQQAVEAKAKAAIAQAQRAAEERDALVEPYRKAAARATERKETAERFAKKQRESVEARVQQERDKRLRAVQKARDAREMDTTRRNIRTMTSQLTQMCEKPTEKSHVSEYLVDKVRPVAMVANDAIGNHEAAARIRAGINGVYGPLPENVTMESAMEGLRRGIAKEVSRSERAAMEWQQSGITDKIDNWLSDVNENRQLEMEKLRGEMANAEKWLTQDTPEKKAYLDRLRADLKAYEDGNLATLNTEQLRGLSEILEQTLYIVKNENVMLGSIEDVMIDDFAEGVHGELEAAAKNQKDDALHKVLREAGSVYKLNTMNIERNFERLGGYRHGGFMEQLGQQLNHGQFRKERITAVGERIFADVTGPKHAEELYHFTHDLVDIGLKTRDGKPWLVTHDVMAELWVQLQNRQGMHHLLYGGATIADMSLATKGQNGLGEQYAETVTLGELVTTDKDGNKLSAYEISKREDTLRTSIIGEIEKNLTAYDDQWIADFKKLGKMTKGYVNETSMALFGTKIARVDNYIRLHVDKNTLVEQNEGIRRDVSVGSEGFTKNRQTSAKPLELVGLVRQAAESIENTAQYAGMAIPLRNAEKVLNTMQGGKTLYGQIERVWGRAGRSYMTKAMADLSGGSKSGSEVFDRLSGKLRGAAAAAVLTGNLNVTLLQAASLPTAAAELGWGSTGAAAVQFAVNLRPSQLNAIVERAYRFGDALLPTRLRGSSRGELSSAAKEQGVGSVLHDGARNSSNAALRYGTRAVDKLADFAGGSIGWMDKVTVASLFHGAESYVQHHLTEYDLTKADLPAKAMEDGTKAYQDAVMSKFQRVVERTQPNYTAMQRTGLQRSKNQLLKTVTMFSTQRQQNAQIMVSAAEDLHAKLSRNHAAQKALKKAKAEDDAPRLAECKAEAEKAAAELKTAKSRAFDAASSQIVQTAVIAGLGMLVKFGLHRWGDLQDENGDMTTASLIGSFVYQFFNSGVSNYTGGSELWTAAESIHNKKLFGTYDSVSMTGFSALNDAVKSITKLNALLDKDTDEMTEKDLDAYHEKVKWAWADTAGQLMMLVGVPYNNGKKYVQAVWAWMDTAKQWGETGERNFNSLPSSATGQYDRLYNAIQSGDAEEAAAARAKLEAMGKDDKTIYSELKRRLKKYDGTIQRAAKAQVAGDDATRRKLTEDMVLELYETLGIDRTDKADAAKREQVIDLVTGAITDVANAQLKGGRAGLYDDLSDALDSGRVKDVQDELNRLMTAGKKANDLKSKVTELVKPVYLAGNDHDRAQMEAMLLKLEDDSGGKLYERKTFEQWVKQAKKKEEQAEKTTDEWAGLR